MTYPTTSPVRLTADVALFADNAPGDPGNQTLVLLIRRGKPPFEGHWALPGGHVHHDETFLRAAYRKLAEETDIFLPKGVLKFAGVYDNPGRDPRGRYVSVAYTLHTGAPTRPNAGDDAAEARWIPVDEVLAGGHPIAFDHARIVTDALRVAT